MQQFIQLTSAENKTKIWSSNIAWRVAAPDLFPASGQLHLPWPEMFYSYSSPIPTVFLGKLTSLSLLKDHKRWLVRDGLVPLIRFFTRFPSPGKVLRTQLLIHFELEKYVPEGWLRFCLFYKLESNFAPGMLEAQVKPKDRTSWIFSSYISETFCSLAKLDSQIRLIKNFNGLAKNAFNNPIWGHYSFDPGSAEFCLNFCAKLARTFTGDISSVSHSDIRQFLDLRKTFIIDLNEKLICADDLNIHIMLARGAAFPDQNSPHELATDFIRCSPYHGFVVRKSKGDHPDIWKDGSFLRLNNYLHELHDVKPTGCFMIGEAPDWIWKFAKFRHLLGLV